MTNWVNVFLAPYRKFENSKRMNVWRKFIGMFAKLQTLKIHQYLMNSHWKFLEVIGCVIFSFHFLSLSLAFSRTLCIIVWKIRISKWFVFCYVFRVFHLSNSKTFPHCEKLFAPMKMRFQWIVRWLWLLDEDTYASIRTHFTLTWK